MIQEFSVVKLFAGNSTRTETVETEEDYAAYVLCILCIVIFRRRLNTRLRHVWSRD